MRTLLVFLVLFICSGSSFGQIIFEKGYFINDENQKIECLIKNIGWKNNPSEFLFKLNESSLPETGRLSSVREFGIYGLSKFINANVAIDRSSNDINKFTYEKKPIWSYEQLFLKVLVEGKATLYSYEDDNLIRYFYSVSDSSINQLVYKEYLVEGNGTAYNNTFRKQLWFDLFCENTSMNSMNNINYTKNDLEKYFMNYIKYKGDTTVRFKNKTTGCLFNLTVVVGSNLSSVSFANSVLDRRYSMFDSNINFGIQTEFILPYNKNKIGILIEPSFQYFNSTNKFNDEIVSLNCKSVEFPIGVKYYMFLSKGVKLFVDGFYISNISYNFNSNVKFSNSVKLEIVNRESYAFGGGIEYKRVSMELRYYSNREILSDYVYWSSDYHRYSFKIGYRILQK